MSDEFYMNRALSLAKRGRGFVSPNPLVGAVIVKNGKIISEAYHKKFGSHHAERAAILKCNPHDLKGSTLYVNLEPCSHFGKTPPCTQIIISAGIKKVVIGQKDPNPLVNGKGIKILQEHGINVKTGVLEKECIELNEVFNKYMLKNEPYITLKIAQTIDGMIATKKGMSKWITCEESRKKVHKLRRDHDAVLVGISTVLTDDPQLTVRKVKGSTCRIILDSKLSIPFNSAVVKSAESVETIIVTTNDSSRQKESKLVSAGCKVWRVKKNTAGMIDVDEFFILAAKNSISSILVEGGRKIFTEFIRLNKFDRLIVFTAPKIFGQGISSIGNLHITDPEKAVTFARYSWAKS
ncbi:bifunctional diaminohydroxyphosphoribosylaminopyrimidine deaminase/5-amino-6-(5-phosphoribosylamino)uracil reductase RibD, partial [candidate division KSB1 bacterium]